MNTINKYLMRFIQFEKNEINNFFKCFWTEMNIVGKILFLPVTIMGIIIIPVVLPIIWGLLVLLTYKPFKK